MAKPQSALNLMPANYPLDGRIADVGRALESSPPWVLVRAMLMSFLLESFMEHGRHPELVRRGVFVIWRSSVSKRYAATKWSEDAISTEISIKDAEGRVPAVPESVTAKASFASIEELGVELPPTQGWYPREKGKKVETSDIFAMLASGSEVPWWANKESKEWICNVSDQMFFHIPSNSLWERRDQLAVNGVEYDEAFSYFRVDAKALQALSMFAATLDSFALPLTWKAWVSYVALRRKKKEPPMSPVAPKKELPQPDVQTSARLVSKAEANEELDAIVRKATRALTRTVSVRVDNYELEGWTEAKEADPSPRQPTKNEDPQLEKAALLPAAAGTNGDRSRPPPRRIFGMFSCFRGKSRVLSPTSSFEKVEETQGGPASADAQLQQAKKNNGGPGQGSQSLQGKANGGDSATTTLAVASQETAVPEVVPPINKLDGAELHSRRLQLFLADLKKNPQRLVAHVEYRRAEKIVGCYGVRLPGKE